MSVCVYVYKLNNYFHHHHDYKENQYIVIIIYLLSLASNYDAIIKYLNTCMDVSEPASNLKDQQQLNCTNEVILLKDKSLADVWSAASHFNTMAIVFGWITPVTATIVKLLRQQGRVVTWSSVEQMDETVISRVRDHCIFSSLFNLTQSDIYIVLSLQDIEINMNSRATEAAGRVLTNIVCLFDSLKQVKPHINLIIFNDNSTIDNDVLTSIRKRMIFTSNLAQITQRQCAWQPNVARYHDVIVDILIDICFTYIHLYQYSIQVLLEHL